MNSTTERSVNAFPEMNDYTLVKYMLAYEEAEKEAWEKYTARIRLFGVRWVKTPDVKYPARTALLDALRREVSRRAKTSALPREPDPHAQHVERWEVPLPPAYYSAREELIRDGRRVGLRSPTLLPSRISSSRAE